MIRFQSRDAEDAVEISEETYEELQHFAHMFDLEVVEGEMNFSSSSLLAKIVQANMVNTDEVVDLIGILESGSTEISYDC